MSNVTKKESNLPAAPHIQGQPYLSSSDLVIPRINLMQATSEQVKKRKAQFGDIVDSSSEAVIGSAEKPIEIIPFSVTKVWNVFKGTRDTKPIDREFLRTETVTAANDNLPFEGTEDGFSIVREKVYNVFCILTEDLMGLPYILSLRRTSSKVAKAIITQMYFRNTQAKLPPYASVVELGAKEESGDNGSYMVFTAKMKRLANQDEKDVCENWLNQISAMKVEPDVEEAPKEKPVQASPKKDIPNMAPGAQKKAVPTIDENEPLPF